MIATLLTLGVAAVHVYFVLLEMALWQKPRTRKIFGTTPDFAKESAVMAANQGLYNGFLGVGLLYGLWLGTGSGSGGAVLVGYLLICVLVAGIYGGFTATKAAFLAQALPASLAILARYFDL